MDKDITKADVFAAADTISSRGVMPSIRMIRHDLGDTGSQSTILKYLREWKEALLMKNNSGCVWCGETAKENEKLKSQLHLYRHMIDYVRNHGKGMLAEMSIDCDSGDKIIDMKKYLAQAKPS